MSLSGYVDYAVKYGLVGRSLLRIERLQSERRARRTHQGADGVLPPLRARFRMKELLSRQYLEGNYVNGVRKVAWVATGAPVEVLQALDYFVYYPDNHSAMCGARKMGVELAAVAEQAGYSSDICSYPRTEIGAFLSGRSAVGKIPKPDLIVCSNNICQTVAQWYQVMAAYHGAPFVNIDTPFLYDEPREHDVAYVKRQIEELIPVAERIAGKRLDYRRLREAIRLGKEASDLWLQILERARHRPSPLTAFDAFVNMGPIVALRGMPSTVAFYRDMLTEVDARIAAGAGAVAPERMRVLWDNLPIWYRLNWLWRLLGKHGVNVVLSNYTYGWAELAPVMDAERPLDSMARVYLLPYLNRSLRHKLEAMKRMVRDFDLQGVILHSDRSCKPYSIGQIDQRERMVKELGVPALLLEADHNDARVFSEQQAQARLEAFIETMESVR
jgi:benzoyl-CoA reductase/2-hydroxyglutaryl-CoA dehydratase subunit BcrC/BadD/HgdB